MFSRLFQRSSVLQGAPMNFLRRIHTSPKLRAGEAVKAASEPERYSKSMRYLHWIIAGGFLGSYGTIHLAYRTQGQTKDTLYKLHNTFGVLLGAAVVPRLFLRLVTKLPLHLPGFWIEHQVAHLGHGALYGLMLFMPITGVSMSYFGGKGQPLIVGNIPGKGAITAEDGEIAKHSFKYHKMVGEWGQYLIAAHVGAAFYHAILGRAIFTRISPFAA